MKHGNQKKLAQTVGISAPYLCEILNGKKRPAWNLSKILGDATKTDPVLWADGNIQALLPEIEKSMEGWS